MKHIFVIDFEATCWENQNKRLYEIIEFPIVVIDVEKLEVVDQFHTYIKPVFHPVLSDFCTQLTGIEQKTVDVGISFLEAVKQFHIFSTKYNNPFIVTCGDWDFAHAYPENCRYWKVHNHVKKWCNVKKVFRDCYGTKPKGMPGMLSELGIPLEGRHHSGIDDSKNIAKIVMRIIKDGFIVQNLYPL